MNNKDVAGLNVFNNLLKEGIDMKKVLFILIGSFIFVILVCASAYTQIDSPPDHYWLDGVIDPGFSPFLYKPSLGEWPFTSWITSTTNGRYNASDYPISTTINPLTEYTKYPGYIQTSRIDIDPYFNARWYMGFLDVLPAFLEYVWTWTTPSLSDWTRGITYQPQYPFFKGDVAVVSDGYNAVLDLSPYSFYNNIPDMISLYATIAKAESASSMNHHFVDALSGPPTIDESLADTNTSVTISRPDINVTLKDICSCCDPAGNCVVGSIRVACFPCF